MPRQATATSRKIDAKPHRIGRKSSVPSPNSTSNEEDRLRMISDAAYFRALGRGFASGDPVDDWLAAEAEIDGIPRDWENPDSLRASVD